MLDCVCRKLPEGKAHEDGAFVNGQGEWRAVSCRLQPSPFTIQHYGIFPQGEKEKTYARENGG